MATGRDVLKAVYAARAAKPLERIPKALQKRYRISAKALRGIGYTPHQGAQECARRLRQIEKGFIKREIF